MRSSAGAMAALSVAMVAAGLLWPHLAATFLSVLVAALAHGCLGTRAYRSGLPTKVSNDVYSPFDSAAPRPRALKTPPAIAHMTTLLQAVADPEGADRALIPADASRILVAEASRRLSEHHGLSPHRPADEHRVRGLVSEATWTLLQSQPGRGTRAATLSSIPMSRLEIILDDVERL